MLNKEKIASTEIFKGLSQEELEEIARLCEEVIFNDGDKLLTEGERAGITFLSWMRGAWISALSSPIARPQRR